MKKIILSSLLIISTIISSHAQLYTPSGTVLGTSTNNNVGIGTANPTKLLDIQNSNSGAGESYIWIKKGIDATSVNREAGIILGANAGDYGNTFKIAAMSSTGYFDAPKLNFKYTNPGGGETIDLLTIDNFGKVGIGITTPSYKLDVFKSTTTNDNDVIANFARGNTTTGGSSIVRFGYHNTSDFEINSGYTTAGHRFGSYFDLNIVNNNKDGKHGGINFATNGSVKMTVRPDGNVGIGTMNPSNDQGWDRVLDVAGLHHSKILATSVNSTFKTGIFSHNESWYGGGGFVGTESNHNLHLITGYSPKVSILTNGDVGIGTTKPDAKLAVNGDIHAKEVRVTLAVPAPDYVFEKYYTGVSKLKSSYTMPTLAEVEQFTKENHHLPNVPSAKEVKENGLQLGEMSNIMLQKIEELTLYVIEQEKKNNVQSKEIETLRKENESFKKLSERLSLIEKELEIKK